MSDRDRDDDELDDASLRSMRAVWLSMRDEEPPAAGMSALLAAAREKAEQMTAKPSWWQRVIAQLRRPPALAFATVLVLIGGAVLVTRGTEDKQVEALSAEQAGARSELRTRDTAEHLKEAEEQDGTPATELAPSPEPATGEAGRETSEPVAAPVIPTRKDTAPSKMKKRRPAADRGLADDEVGHDEPDRHHRFEVDVPKGGFAAGKESVDTNLGSPGATTPRVPATPAGTKTQDKPPMKPAEPPPVAAPEPAPEHVTVTATDASKPATSSPSEQLARQAESAAARGDCAAVKAIVARLKQQDEAFFKARLGKNAAVTRCL